MARKLLTHVALLVLGGLLSPIALGFAAPRVPKLPKGQTPRTISGSELAAADRLDKQPSSTKSEKLAALKALGVRIPAGQIGEPFELSPRRPFVDGVTWMGMRSADTFAGKNVALILPVMGGAELHFAPARDKVHLVECYADMLGNPFMMLMSANADGDTLATSLTEVIDHRVSFVIPAQKQVRSVVVGITAGPVDELVLKPFDPVRFMLRSCEITPLG